MRHHGFALFLLGWYLLLPLEGINPAKWIHVAAFDSARECQAKLVKERDKPISPLDGHALWVNAVCLESSDPRLAR